MATQKELGNEQFKQKNYEKAIEFYTEALDATPTDHTILGNRSMAYLNLKQNDKALIDAEKCIAIKADWGKGYHRKGAALHAMERYEDSMEAYVAGLKIDPNNNAMKNGMEAMRRDAQAKMMGGSGGGGGSPTDLFSSPEAEAKLKADDRTKKYFEDPQFCSMWAMLKQQPQMMMQLFQSDPRMMDCFKVLTGIDLMDVQEKEMKARAQEEEEKKKRKAELEKKQAEDAKAQKEAEEAALPPEEKARLAKKKEADEIKAKGNAYYKAKDFDNALKMYQEAIDTNPDEPMYFSNMAAVYFEMKQFEKAIEECDKGMEICKGANYDFVKAGKILARKANAQVQLGQYDESIATYQAALLENNEHTYKQGLNKAKKAKSDAEAAAYISPEKAEEHRQKGNELFKAGKFADAIKEYDEGLRRDPKAVAIYSNRCATYIKLMEFPTALKDADKCLDLDPKFVKAYARKGNCHHMMKEYHKAMKSYDDGLKIDPDNKDCIDGKQKTIMTINTQAHAGGENDEERLRHAMADPEIQRIMQDPTIQMVLKDLQQDPKSAMSKMKDPYISDCLNKLVAAGVLKMG